MKSDFNYIKDDSFDFVLEEKGNSSINLRKIRWGESEPKIDIRKWYYNADKEICGKGVSLSDEGANELANVLCENGYGDVTRILKALKSRSDYNKAPTESQPDNEEEEFYDPKQLLGR